VNRTGFSSASFGRMGLPQGWLTSDLCGRGPCWKDVHYAKALSNRVSS